MKYRVFIGNCVSRKERVHRGYHFQATAISLQVAWEKANGLVEAYNMRVRTGSAILTPNAMKIKASNITRSPTRIGYIRDGREKGNDGIFIQLWHG